MSQQLQQQVIQWWQAVASQETLNTYQKTIQVTWNVAQETVKLLWLILCLGFVLLGWLWQKSISSGQELKIWLHDLEEPKANKIWLDTKEFVIERAQYTAMYLQNKARTQLGLSEVAPPPKVPKTVSQPKPIPIPPSAADSPKDDSTD